MIQWNRLYFDEKEKKYAKQNFFLSFAEGLWRNFPSQSCLWVRVDSKGENWLILVSIIIIISSNDIIATLQSLTNQAHKMKRNYNLLSEVGEFIPVCTKNTCFYFLPRNTIVWRNRKVIYYYYYFRKIRLSFNCH